MRNWYKIAKLCLREAQVPQPLQFSIFVRDLAPREKRALFSVVGVSAIFRLISLRSSSGSIVGGSLLGGPSAIVRCLQGKEHHAMEQWIWTDIDILKCEFSPPTSL